jgi:uncharacterized protein
MKWSKFNILHESEVHGWLLFNKLSTFLLDLNDTELRTVIFQISKDPELFFSNNNDPDFKLKLLQASVLVEDDAKNINYLNLISTKDKFNRSSRALTILPTLDCNFSCSYCYEKGNLKKKFMNEKAIEDFKEFINKEFNFEETKKLHIQWYGGEPLMNFNAIEKISTFFKSKKVNYSSSIVTNGYLLTNHIIEKLHDYKINHIQVTIDGPKHIHDDFRKLKNGKGTYDVIIQNLSNLNTYIKEHQLNIKVSLRVNIGNNNKDIYSITKTKLDELFQNENFIVYPGFIVDTNICNTSEGCGFSSAEKAKFYLEQYEKYDNFDLNYYPLNLAVNNCIAQRFYDYTVGPVGELYSCWRDVGDDTEIIGNIKTGFTNKCKIGEYTTGITDVFRDANCLKCDSIAICGGGCPNLRYREYILNQPQELCSYFNDQETLLKLIDIHYEILKKKYPKI